MISSCCCCRIGCGLRLVPSSSRRLIAGCSLVSVPLSILLLGVSLLDCRWRRLSWKWWLLASIVSGSVCGSISSAGVVLVHRSSVGITGSHIRMSIVESCVMLAAASSIAAKTTAAIAAATAGVLWPLVRRRLLICGISIARTTVLICVAGWRAIPLLLLESTSCGLFCRLSPISVLELRVWLLAKGLSNSRSGRLAISRTCWGCCLAVLSIVDAGAAISLGVLLIRCSR